MRAKSREGQFDDHRCTFGGVSETGVGRVEHVANFKVRVGRTCLLYTSLISNFESLIDVASSACSFHSPENAHVVDERCVGKWNSVATFFAGSTSESM